MQDIVFREGFFDGAEFCEALEGDPASKPLGYPSTHQEWVKAGAAPGAVAGIVAALSAAGGLDQGAAPPVDRSGMGAGLWKKAGLLDLMAEWPK